jgi:hypothetical protein
MAIIPFETMVANGFVAVGLPPTCAFGVHLLDMLRNKLGVREWEFCDIMIIFLIEFIFLHLKKTSNAIQSAE